MFEDSAELGEILDTTEQLKVSKVVHKASIDVNEAGTEAAAGTCEHLIRSNHRVYTQWFSM